MKKINLVLFFCFIAFAGSSQIRNMLVRKETNFNLDSMEVLSDLNPEKTYVIIYDRTDSNNRNTNERTFGEITPACYITNNFNITFIYFHKDNRERVCSDVPLKFVISGETHDIFMRTVPACIIFTHNQETMKLMEDDSTFIKFNDVFSNYPGIYHHVYLSIDPNGMRGLISSGVYSIEKLAAEYDTKWNLPKLDYKMSGIIKPNKIFIPFYLEKILLNYAGYSKMEKTKWMEPVVQPELKQVQLYSAGNTPTKSLFKVPDLKPDKVPGQNSDSSGSETMQQ